MRFAILTACLCSALVTACHDDEVCNPGLVLEGGVCVPYVPPPDASPTATPEAGTPVDAGGGSDGNGSD
jgi:hypothetical protein